MTSKNQIKLHQKHSAIAQCGLYNKEPNIYEAVFSKNNLPHLPATGYLKSEQAEKYLGSFRKELIKQYPKEVSKAINIGQNTSGIINRIIDKAAVGYISQTGNYVCMVEVPSGLAISVIEGFKTLTTEGNQHRLFVGVLNNSGLVNNYRFGASNKDFVLTSFWGASLVHIISDDHTETIELLENLPVYDTLDEETQRTVALQLICNMMSAFAGQNVYDFSDSANQIGYNLSENLESLSDCEYIIFGDEDTLENFKKKYSLDYVFANTLQNDGYSKTMQLLSNLNIKYSSVERSIEEIKEKFGWYELPSTEYVEYFTKVVKFLTYAERMPMINNAPLSLKLIGASGTGKSTIVEVASWLVGKEYRPIIASSEKFSEGDLLATLVPMLDVEDKDLLLPNEHSLKEEFGISFQDILFSPEMAYKTIYGKDYDGVGKIDIESMCNELARKQMDKSNKENSFMMVLTDIGRTLLYGGVVEPQEYNMISNLNEASYFYRILEERLFTLPNGKQYSVHPDAHIIFTMNKSENFTRDMPPAFRNRQFATIIFSPTGAKEMAQQCHATFSHYGYDLNIKSLNQMAQFIENCREYSDFDEILSLRTLNNWVMAILDDEDIKDAANAAVIGTASSNPLNIKIMEELLNDTLFTPIM